MTTRYLLDSNTCVYILNRRPAAVRNLAESTNLTCRCGKVALRATGRPILTADCTCTSCREAAAIVKALPDGETLLDAHGGTRLVLYRKDRLDCLAGAEQLGVEDFRRHPV